MVHPDSELRFINPEIGYGVVATRLIPRGTITWAPDELDQVFTPDQVRAISPFMRAQFEKYTFVNGDGHYVLCWDHGRLMNHSCEPSCLSSGFSFEIAVRDILPGEELTCDYATLNPTEPFSCACAAPQCRNVIAPDDMLKHADRWDRIVASTFHLVTAVPQLLWPLVDAKEDVAKAAAGLRPIPSSVVHYAKRRV